MGKLLFDCTVWLGRLFMASLFLFMIILMIPFMGIFAVLDRYARRRVERARHKFID